jgi:hypothetical protein
MVRHTPGRNIDSPNDQRRSIDAPSDRRRGSPSG